MERRKLSEKSGATRTTFSSLKKVSASPLLHHSVGKGYHEGVVPRSLDCCQFKAHRQHILWHHLLAQTGFVFMMKFDAKFSFSEATQLHLPTKIKVLNECSAKSNTLLPYISCAKRPPSTLGQLHFIVDIGLQHPFG